MTSKLLIFAVLLVLAADQCILIVAVLQELNLVVSVGIASNKMLAKLASQNSKPDGILVVDSDDALQQLLQATPAARLPRCGGKVSNALGLAGVHTVADLQV